MMSKRVQFCLAGLLATLLVGLVVWHTPPARGQQAKTKTTVWLYGLDFDVRKGDEPNFNDKTRRWGSETFKDEHTGNQLYVSEAGKVAAAASASLPAAAVKDVKPPAWSYGLGLVPRKAGEEEASPTSKKWGVEVFKDDNTGALIYFVESGALSALPAPTFTRPEKVKGPTRLHALELKCRKAGEADFKNAKAWGVEVFKDENSGLLVYFSETGSIAVVNPSTAVAASKSDPKSPAWVHGLELPVRKATEASITKDTKVWGLEVFKDENTGVLVYITENGNIGACVPAAAPNPQKKGWTRIHATELKCRKGKDKDWKEPTAWGVEIYRDEHAGCLVYITETGDLSVLPAK